MIDKELRDEKAVHVAVNRLYAGEYVIDVHANEAAEQEAAQEEETVAFDAEDVLSDAE